MVRPALLAAGLATLAQAAPAAASVVAPCDPRVSSARACRCLAGQGEAPPDHVPLPPLARLKAADFLLLAVGPRACRAAAR